MKYILYILLFISQAAHSQHLYNNRWVMGPGEYYSALVDVPAKRLWQLIDLPSRWGSGVPDSFVSCAGGAHYIIALTAGGRVAGWGDNGNGELGIGNTTSQSTPVFIATDSLGNTFGNVIKVGASGSIGWLSYAIKSDGTLWAWGDLELGTRGNGTVGGQTTRPVQIPFPAGTFIKDAYIDGIAVALDSAGNVWDWGGNGIGGGFWTPYLLSQGSSTPNVTSPTKLTIPVRVKMIGGHSGLPAYAIGVNNRIYGWSYKLSYIGIRGTKDMSNFGWNPIDITDSLGFTGVVDTIVSNSMATLAILTDSSLWGWGSNACANMGNGPGLDMRHYTTPGGTYAPYAWDQGLSEAMQIKPVQIMAGKSNFTKIFASSSFNFWFNVEDVHDSLYGWGRNKYDILGNMVTEVDSSAGVLGSTYPNGWDVNYATYIDPFRPSKVIRSTCPLCADSAGGNLCPTYPVNGSAAAPTCSADSNQTITTSWTTLRGTKAVSGSTSGIMFVNWTCTAKPGGAPNPIMPLQANDTISVSGLQLGLYTFQYSVQSSDFKTTTASVNVVVGCVSCAVRQSGTRRKYFNL